MNLTEERKSRSEDDAASALSTDTESGVPYVYVS